MPSADTTLAFFGVALLLGFTPGPDNLFVLMQSATHGRRSGMLVVLGLCTGLIVHTAAVVLADKWERKYPRELAAYPVASLRDTKYWPPVGRADNVYGDRNLFCACVPLDEYK